LDTFDFEFGKKLALKRLDLKIAEKRADSMKASAKFCRMNLEFIEQEKRRLKKALTRAEVSYSDRMVEVQQFKDEINTMLTGI
jgi:hypothetical protein